MGFVVDADNVLLVVENWARQTRDRFSDRFDGMLLHGEEALSGPLLMQWFMECFSELHTELRNLRTEEP